MCKALTPPSINATIRMGRLTALQKPPGGVRGFACARHGPLSMSQATMTTSGPDRFFQIKPFWPKPLRTILDLNSTKGPPKRGKKERKLWRERDGKEKARNFGPPPFGAPHFRAPHFRAPPLRGPTPSGPRPSLLPSAQLLHKPETAKKRSGPKVVWAQSGRARSG